MGGIRDSVAGRRVTSAFMSLSNSSSWFRTGARVTEKDGQEKDGGRERWSQEKRRGIVWTDTVRKGEGDVEESETKKVTEVDGDRERLKGKESARRRERNQTVTEDRRRAGKKKGVWRGERGGHWKTWGGELSEHPILKNGVWGLGMMGRK